MVKKNYNKMGIGMLPTVAIGFIISFWPQSGLSQDVTAPQQDGWAKYQIIFQRNIFSRQRGPIRQREVDDRPGRVITPSLESYFLLKGIVQEDGKFIAFIEDNRAGGILRLHEGDSVARGIIKALNLDSIVYQLEDRAVTVTMGHDLEGGQGAVTMTQLYEWSQTSSAAQKEGVTQPSGPSGDDADILRQLMQRRQQQIGQ